MAKTVLFFLLVGLIGSGMCATSTTTDSSTASVQPPGAQTPPPGAQTPSPGAQTPPPGAQTQATTKITTVAPEKQLDDIIKTIDCKVSATNATDPCATEKQAVGDGIQKNSKDLACDKLDAYTDCLDNCVTKPTDEIKSMKDICNGGASLSLSGLVLMLAAIFYIQ